MTPNEQQDAIAKIRQRIQGRKPPVMVLLVEDDEKDAELTVSALQGAGVNVVWAKDSQQAQDYMIANDPWLVFLDLKLGPDDRGELGLNILELIKSYKRNVIVVILTGQYRHDSDNCLKALSKGADAIMLKPLTSTQIRLIFASP